MNKNKIKHLVTLARVATRVAQQASPALHEHRSRYGAQTRKFLNARYNRSGYSSIAQAAQEVLQMPERKLAKVALALFSANTAFWGAPRLHWIEGYTYEEKLVLLCCVSRQWFTTHRATYDRATNAVLASFHK